MEKPLIISFYTKNTPYEKEMQGLIDSAKPFDLEMDIVGIDSLGTWEKNCCYKPTFIRKMLEKHNRPLLWLDADAEILKEPSQCYEWEYDFATRINSYADLMHPSKYITGTVYVRPTRVGRKILEVWEKESQSGDLWDQVSLRDALVRHDLLDKAHAIPLSYGAIIHHPDELKDAVILHHQASRTFKPFIDQTVNPILLQELDPLNSAQLKEFRQQISD